MFSIELCAYAIMSNHYHLVVKLVPGEAIAWSDDEVLGRWTALFHGPLLVQRYQAGVALSDIEMTTLRSVAAVFRRRLADLSWFMKCLNEPIARLANREDDCTGHFWEARFHSQALQSERALVAAMAYVDLNPVRAGIAVSPERSEFTSLRARLQTKDVNKRFAEFLGKGDQLRSGYKLRPLLSFSVGHESSKAATLPIREPEYLKLVALTGRVSVHGKRGRIDPALVPIFERLNLSADEWVKASSAFERRHRAGDLKKFA